MIFAFAVVAFTVKTVEEVSNRAAAATFGRSYVAPRPRLSSYHTPPNDPHLHDAAYSEGLTSCFHDINFKDHILHNYCQVYEFRIG